MPADAMPDSPTPKRRFNFQRLAFGTIQNKIVLPFLLLTLLVTILGTFVVTRLVATNLQDRLTTQLLETSRAASDSIVAWERRHLEILRLVVFTAGVPESLEARDADPLRDALVALASNQNVHLLIGLDPDGEVIAAAQRRADGYETDILIGENLADVPAIQHVLNGEADQFGDKYAGVFDYDGEQLILTVAPVFNAANEQVGAVAVATPLSEVLSQTKVETLADVTLYADESRILHTTLLLPDPDDMSVLAIPPAYYEAALSDSETETPLLSTTLNEREYQTAFVPLVIRRDSLGVLGVSWPATLITSVISTNRNGLAAMFALVAVLVVLMGYTVAISLSRPIRRLAQAAQAVAAGDLNQQSMVRTEDEIGVLGRTFDQMTVNLSEKTDALTKSYAEQERRAAFLSAVINSAADGTVVLDLDGEMSHRNPAANAVIDPNPLLWHSLLTELVQELADSNRLVKRLEVDSLWYDLTASPVVGQDGEKTGIVVTMHDVTEQVLTDRMRTAFILQMSHELYTPLVTARGYTELAKRTVSKETPLVQNLLNQSLESMTTLRDLIGQILDISRMIRGGFEITPQDVNLAKLITTTIDEFRELADSKGLKLQIDIGKLRLYTAGEEPLKWMVKHLIKNAIDYTPSGGIIKITASDADEGYSLKVRDTGVGIARHEKPHIFEQFYRGQPTAANGSVIDIRGAGLGLFVVDQVVRAHGGTVEVWSEPGIGTEFTVRLPHSIPSAAAKAAPDTQAERTTA